ncbi:(Fe-S)-binding protein [Desulfovibrio ferrophilus]|uniref:Fe-S oxidoreductase n=1 Tax=Desulfovibrio ferrophilus TaxID=241368 RepID=A0A2Z6B000_9BACT|nr:(Fe-S)-binding protein [Desulfovibrio ferrophilus]BBD08847.1 Fe-S oxidoreductase [Desulfovibrio ferrophilus]
MQQDNDITDEKQKPQCILCGKCLEVCPLLAATGREEFSPRGKLLLLSRLAEAPETLSEADAERLASLCLTCGRCAKACPQGTDVPAEVSRLRAKHPGFQRWLWKTWVERSGLLWPAAAKLGNVLKGKLPGRSDGVAAGLASKLATMGLGGELVPWIAAESFDACPQAPKIVLFPGCLARSVRTDWTDKALSLLNRLGAQVQDAPDWACCGGTLGHAGLLERQREAARTNVRAWREAGRPSIVTYCASCHHGLASYMDLNGLEFEDGEVEVWTKALVPLSELVACGRFGVVDAAPEQVHYHQPCHAPEPDPDRAWMTKAVGERLAPVDGKACCGMGGVLQMAAPGLSSQVAGNLWESMRPAPGDQVITGCSGCWLQLASTAPEGVCVGHWLDLLQYIETPTP